MAIPTCVSVVSSLISFRLSDEEIELEVEIDWQIGTHPERERDRAEVRRIHSSLKKGRIRISLWAIHAIGKPAREKEKVGEKERESSFNAEVGGARETG